MVPEAKEELINYSQSPLLWDENFQKNCFNLLIQAGLEVEKAFGSAQDIEGVLLGDKISIVQSRPQVGLNNVSK
ncbi:MAG: hypothetical protein HQL32_07180 [Planctomycetes bacterium]|nr:hypothetical protein [Planctomycetota bacterium]